MKTNKLDIVFYVLIVALLLIIVHSAVGQETQTNENLMSGGPFTIPKTVVAGGGQTMQNSPTGASTTAGQAAAGKTLTGGQFSLYSGFWTPENFTPTAATVVAGGHVRTADGRGIRNARVVITFPGGETRVVLSGSLGYYRFTDIPAGETYVFNVQSKRFTFSVGTMLRNLNDDTEDIHFVAEPDGMP